LVSHTATTVGRSSIYSGVMFVELGIDDVDMRHPELARIVGRGLMFALGDSKALIGYRDANAHIGIYATMRMPEEWVEASSLDWSSADAMRTSLAGHFSDWSEDLLQLIYKSSDRGERIAPRPIYALPVGSLDGRPSRTLSAPTELSLPAGAARSILVGSDSGGVSLRMFLVVSS
jgi:hypothetical protein